MSLEMFRIGFRIAAAPGILDQVPEVLPEVLKYQISDIRHDQKHVEKLILWFYSVLGMSSDVERMIRTQCIKLVHRI